MTLIECRNFVVVAAADAVVVCHLFSDHDDVRLYDYLTWRTMAVGASNRISSHLALYLYVVIEACCSSGSCCCYCCYCYGIVSLPQPSFLGWYHYFPSKTIMTMVEVAPYHTTIWMNYYPQIPSFAAKYSVAVEASLFHHCNR